MKSKNKIKINRIKNVCSLTRKWEIKKKKINSLFGLVENYSVVS